MEKVTFGKFSSKQEGSLKRSFMLLSAFAYVFEESGICMISLISGE